MALAGWRSAPKTPLVVVLCVVSFISFLMHVVRLVSLWTLSGLIGAVRLIFSYARRPPMGGSASSNVMFGGISVSSTALAVESAVSLFSMSMCDLTFLMCVWSCFCP